MDWLATQENMKLLWKVGRSKVQRNETSRIDRQENSILQAVSVFFRELLFIDI